MKSASILLVLAVFTGAARGALEGGCGRAGALRCDADGRHVSACTKGGAWWRVRDCGASHATCVDGRCVPQVSSNATRAEECMPNTWGCKNCEIRQYCSAGGKWFEVEKCGSENVCLCGECKPEASNKCPATIPSICSPSAVDKSFPNPLGCNSYLVCSQAWEPPTAIPCPPNERYDPCEGGCNEGSFCWENPQCNSSNVGASMAVSGNPSLYYLCAGNTTTFYSCTDETQNTYYPQIEECGKPTVLCSNGYGEDLGRKKYVSYDDCSIGCTPGEKRAADNVCEYYFCVQSDDSRLLKCPPNTKFDALAKNCVESSGSCT